MRRAYGDSSLSMLKHEKDVTLTPNEVRGKGPETKGLTTDGVLVPSVPLTSLGLPARRGTWSTIPGFA